MSEQSNTYVSPEFQRLWIARGFRQEYDDRFIPPDKTGSLQDSNFDLPLHRIYPEQEQPTFADLLLLAFACFFVVLCLCLIVGVLFVWLG